MTQGEMRSSIDVGPGTHQVSPVSYWYHQGHFESDAEARGAFKLAHQQGLEGMGASVPEWMGLTADEFDAWVRRDELPPRRSETAS